MRNCVLTVIILFACGYLHSQEMSFKKTITQDSVHFSILNHIYTPVEVTLTAQDSVKSYIRIKEYFMIESLDTVPKILSLPIERIKDTSSITLSRYVTIKAVMGDPNNSQHDIEYRYALPYSKGKKYKVIQAFGGSFSHNTIRAKYAVDFKLNIGDTVCAAREGIVVRSKDRFTESGGRDYIDKANHVDILHQDGTLASYVHLDHKGVLVAPGDFVDKGQPIGISGNTGFSTTPHLHFVVRTARNISVPMTFEGYKQGSLIKGQKYKRKK